MLNPQFCAKFIRRALNKYQGSNHIFIRLCSEQEYLGEFHSSISSYDKLGTCVTPQFYYSSEALYIELLLMLCN